MRVCVCVCVCVRGEWRCGIKKGDNNVRRKIVCVVCVLCVYVCVCVCVCVCTEQEGAVRHGKEKTNLERRPGYVSGWWYHPLMAAANVFCLKPMI